jgi:2,4-dienoyl-CoA reductase-like NADH-dependent reductase (Old Yellow Enzyme family)
MSNLFTPLQIKSILFRNRLAISPMCQYSAIDGFVNDWHLIHLGSRAVGGAGLIIQEATAVSPEGRISPGDLGLYLDEHIEKLKVITSFIEQQGAVAGIQLAHAGRKAGCSRSWDGGKQLKENEGGWETKAPSPIAFLPDDRAPLELDIPGIRKIVQDFKAAAGRALQSGYKVLEIHAAHGYLIHQFLSPLSNHRQDSYGGSFLNRIQLLLEIVQAIQTVWPSNLPLFVRISATDWAESGWNEEEAVKLSRILKENGVDLIDCSSGGLISNAKIPLAPGYQVPFAERIRKEAGIMTSAVGLITSARQAEEILANNQADLIMIGRASLRDPYFVLNAAKELEEPFIWPLQYARASK